jgi:hypothetical protein
MKLYNLCLKLKKAGFPQPYGNYPNGSDRMFYFQKKYILPFRAIKEIRYNNGYVMDYNKEIVYIPILEEVIEKLGDDLTKLEKYEPPFEWNDNTIIYKNHWRATSESKRKNSIWCKTPLKAVIKLYLEIQKVGLKERK